MSLLPSFKLYSRAREDTDDEFVAYQEGGEAAGDGHSHGPSEKDLRLYKASMFKLKVVSFVSIFFIIA